MKNKFQTPLSVFVLYDKENPDGDNIFDDVYHLLCRNANRPLTDGLDIPVYFRTNNDKGQIPDIDFETSQNIAVLLLIDECMYCNEDIWRAYIEPLVRLSEEQGNIKIYAVSLFKYATDFSKLLNNAQFIVLPDFNLKKCWTEFQIRIFDCLIRQLKGDSEKIKLFISHSKKDEDKMGVTKAEELRNYLRTDTKLSSFYDANDILEGYSFARQIEQNVGNSILIILETVTYSEREWCRIETIVGKEKRVPAIVVSLLNGTINRTFPYLGNMPKVRYDGRWDNVIALALRTALDQYYEKSYLSSLQREIGLGKAIIFPFMPELINTVELADEQTILYPEPPLGREELAVLTKVNKRLSFMTPSQVYSSMSKLQGKRIAISVSNPGEELKDRGIGLAMLKDLSVELARHILVGGGELVYGGDLRADGFTEIFSELSYQYGLKEQSGSDVTYFTNYFAWPIYNKLSKSQLADYKHYRVKVVKADPPQGLPTDWADKFVPYEEAQNFWRESLTRMRGQMEADVNARIVLGGAVTGFKGDMPGIYEEAIAAIGKRHPLYVLGGFGGAASRLAHLVKGKVTVNALWDECRQDEAYAKYIGQGEEPSPHFNKLSVINSQNLNNGLSEDENIHLFESTNIAEIIAFILKGLSENLK